MKIQKIIINSTELDKSWKSKGGALAFVVAAALFGGHQYVQAHQSANNTQYVDSQQARMAFKPSSSYDKNYKEMIELAKKIRSELAPVSGVNNDGNINLGDEGRKYLDQFAQAAAIASYIGYQGPFTRINDNYTPIWAAFRTAAVQSQTKPDEAGNLESKWREKLSRDEPRNYDDLQKFLLVNLKMVHELALLSKATNQITAKNQQSAQQPITTALAPSKTVEDTRDTQFVSQATIDQNTLKELNDYAQEVLANKITQEVVNNSGERALGYWQDQIDNFAAEMNMISNPSIQKQYKTILDKLQANINLYKSYLNSPNYIKNKDTVERILDFKQENKDFFPVSSKTVEKYGQNGLDFLEKNYQKFVDEEGDVNVADGANQQKYERLIAQFKSDVSSYKSFLAKTDASSQPTKPDLKQDQSTAASKSPNLPLPKSLNTSIPGFDAKTTGKGTGITKNGDIYTGEWKNGFANGLGERTLLNKGYTGGLVKTGNKLNTEWKNGIPVDGAKVTVTNPDGKVFHGHIKSSRDTPWGYVIVK